MKTRKILITLLFGLSGLAVINAQNHPCLTLTHKDVADISRSKSNENLFTSTINAIKRRTDISVKTPMVVPLPKDAGGGYTHEQHKKNYTNMYEAGLMYQLYNDKKYADYIKDGLMKYAKMYPSLPLHPVIKSSYRGKLFWQGLNESVWLFYTSQAYDCIYDYLSKKEKEYIENNLFKPMVKFIAVDNEKTFSKIHNHGTWSVASVGMISYVMGDKDMVEKSLLGPKKDGKAGFLRQIEELFSPDGYFVEGPYYQRYSLQPFITFAQVINNNEPERKIFELKDGVLVKAVTTLLQMTDNNGELFKFNDSLEKNWKTTELIWGVDIAYSITEDPELLYIAKQQNSVTITGAGYKVAQDIEKAKLFKHTTLNISDGPNGENGGIGVLRTGEEEHQTTMAMKYTSQGMGHGHFDRLGFIMFDNNNDIITDYGAARFLNIEQKNGGHYLYENDKYAKQTIAHNALVVDEKSHFNGNLKEASKYSPALYAFDNTADTKLISAIETNAADGVKMHRSIFLLSEKYLGQPLVIDLMKVQSDKTHKYDLPLHYSGHLIHTNYKYAAQDKIRKALGNKNGYEFFWVEAIADSLPATATTTWLKGNRFYTLSVTSNNTLSIYLNKLGANDPNFNLRNEPSILLRQNNAKNTTIVSTIEIHGDYNPQKEYTINPYSSIKEIKIKEDNAKYTVIEILLKNDKTITVCMSNENNTPSVSHQCGKYKWEGIYKIIY